MIRDDDTGAGPGHGRAGAVSPGPMSPAQWNDAYAGVPHWDTGRPQPALQRLAEVGAIRGRVLDVGCGTGEHVLMCAALGLDATGIDLAPAAIRVAEHKARQRGLTARFLVGDVRDLPDSAERFDTVLDSGLFHIFDDADRPGYVRAVRSVLVPGGRYLVLCFSDRLTAPSGPRRVSLDELAAAFADGWRTDSITPVSLQAAGPQGIPGWLVSLTRL